jgi:hypothetical protein
MRKSSCTIDEMETLLGQLRDFEKQIKNPRELSDPAFRQEYQMFRQYLQWRIEDINKAMRDEMQIHISSLR